MLGGSEMPAEFSAVDGLVAGVYYGGGDERPDAFLFGVPARDRADRLLGDEHAGGLASAPGFSFAFAFLDGLAEFGGLQLEDLGLD